MQLPKIMTRAIFRLRTLTVAQALFLLVALGVPIAAMAAITSVTIGAQSPNPVTAGDNATYPVTTLTDATGGTKITAVSGLPTGVTFSSDCGSASDGTTHNVLTIDTSTGTAAATYPIVVEVTSYGPGASCSGSPDSTSGSHGASLVVSTTGPAAEVRVETAANGSGTVVPAQSLTSGSTLTVYAISRDASHTFIANVSATWSLQGRTGGIVAGDLVGSSTSTTGTSAVLTGRVAGTATIRAVATFTGDSGLITVTAGTASKVRVETAASGSGTVVPAQSLTLNNNLTVYAISRDASDNFVANVSATWSLASHTGGVVDGDLVGSTTSTTGTSAVFHGHSAGTATIRAVATFTGDSGLITVVAAASSGTGTMTVSPTSVVVASTGNSLVFTFTSPASSGFTAGSYVTLTVPIGWTAPTTSNTAVANVTGTSCGPARAISGSGPWVITVTQTCAGGNSFSLTYSSVTAPAAAGIVTFAAASHSGSGGTATALTTSPSVTVTAGTFSKLQVLVPGETAAPGTATGKTGTPTTEGAGATFTVTVNAVDANWNVVSSVHVVAITSSDSAATLPANAALVAGTRGFSVILNTVGSKTVTATDVTDATKTAGTSAAITVVTPATIQLVRSAGMVTYGGSVGFSIQFASLGGTRTFVLEHTYVGSAWTTIATLTTNASGFSSFSYAPTRTGYYRVRFAGAADLGAANSAVILVGVRQTITLAPTHAGVLTIAKGRSIAFRSTVRPLRPDLLASRVTFRFYQKVSGAWVLKYERHVAADSVGTARTTFRFGVPGSWYVMAFADRTLTNAVSRFSQREVFLVQ